MQGKLRIPIIDSQPIYVDVDKFEYVKGDIWYQRLALWLAEKVGVLKRKTIPEIASYKFAELDIKDINEAIFKQRENINMMTSGKAKYVLIGHSFIPELARASYLGSHQFSYVTTGINRFERSYTKHLLGLELLFLPYIEGVVVLPDLEDLKR